LLLTLWLTKRAFSSTGDRSLKLAFLIGICVFGMCATRNTGLAILPVFPMLDLRNARPRRITWFSITIILCSFPIQSWCSCRFSRPGCGRDNSSLQFGETASKLFNDQPEAQQDRKKWPDSTIKRQSLLLYFRYP
jgi:hypothetical protein